MAESPLNNDNKHECDEFAETFTKVFLRTFNHSMSVSSGDESGQEGKKAELSTKLCDLLALIPVAGIPIKMLAKLSISGTAKGQDLHDSMKAMKNLDNFMKDTCPKSEEFDEYFTKIVIKESLSIFNIFKDDISAIVKDSGEINKRCGFNLICIEAIERIFNYLASNKSALPTTAHELFLHGLVNGKSKLPEFYLMSGERKSTFFKQIIKHFKKASSIEPMIPSDSDIERIYNKLKSRETATAGHVHEDGRKTREILQESQNEILKNQGEIQQSQQENQNEILKGQGEIQQSQQENQNEILKGQGEIQQSQQENQNEILKGQGELRQGLQRIENQMLKSQGTSTAAESSEQTLASEGTTCAGETPKVSHVNDAMALQGSSEDGAPADKLFVSHVNDAMALQGSSEDGAPADKLFVNAASHSIFKNTNISEYQQKSLQKKKVLRIKSDGHCIIQSFIECMKDFKEYADNPHYVNDIIDKLKNEISRKRTIYREFFTRDVNIESILEAIATSKIYDLEVCDIFIHALSNCYDVTIAIVEETGGVNKVVYCITPTTIHADSRSNQRVIHLLRSGNHHDAMVSCGGIADEGDAMTINYAAAGDARERSTAAAGGAMTRIYAAAGDTRERSTAATGGARGGSNANAGGAREGSNANAGGDQLNYLSLRDCPHKLTDAKYNDEIDLFQQLDKRRTAVGNWYNFAKQFPFIDEDTTTGCYLSYFGGGCPAMAYLYYMATVKRQTVNGFMADLVSNEMGDLAQWLSKQLPNGDDKVVITDVPNDVLEKLSLKLSPSIHHHGHLAKTWKNLAGKHLDRKTIQSIENTEYELNETSPTEQLFDVIRASRPNITLSEVASKLYNIGRMDLITQCIIFNKCKEQGCFETTSYNLEYAVEQVSLL